ncbi:hypothetical protein PACILC2_03140 [Paenibacillus cisolokensis]|uniref:Uncharacterized protein n=1 Tax=Paenibacillus cisolokensis TaxID=1658519 RepID=A0ABQ4N0N6_9BACL|nr:hypothetical protein [Paenibacillus cisolokensis]GIQ61746.1 hypothetical protein PACILC2_03140 [Paenibacillus cisolokensis]
MLKIGKGLVAACAATLAAAVLISWLPQLGRESPSRREVAVFRPDTAKRLTGGNIVDALIGLRLSDKIGRVGWRNAVLAVDIKVPAGEGDPGVWFRDVKKLLRMSFAQMENVNRLLVRYMEEAPPGAPPHSSGAMLFAIDARRTDDWVAGRMDELDAADPVTDDMWRKRLRLTFAKRWEERFGPIQPAAIPPSS